MTLTEINLIHFNPTQNYQEESMKKSHTRIQWVAMGVFIAVAAITLTNFFSATYILTAVSLLVTANLIKNTYIKY